MLLPCQCTGLCAGVSVCLSVCHESTVSPGFPVCWCVTVLTISCMSGFARILACRNVSLSYPSLVICLDMLLSVLPACLVLDMLGCAHTGSAHVPSDMCFLLRIPFCTESIYMLSTLYNYARGPVHPVTHVSPRRYIAHSGLTICCPSIYRLRLPEVSSLEECVGGCCNVWRKCAVMPRPPLVAPDGKHVASLCMPAAGLLHSSLCSCLLAQMSSSFPLMSVCILSITCCLPCVKCNK